MESFVWAGEKGFHLGTALFLPDIGMLEKGVPAYEEALAKNGHDRSQREIMAITQMFCGRNHEKALAEGRKYANNYYRHFAVLSGATEKNPIYPYYSRVDALDLNANGQLLLGSPDALIERISQYQEDYGLDYIMMEIAQGGAEHEVICEALETFAAEVMPHFRNAEAPREKLTA